MEPVQTIYSAIRADGYENKITAKYQLYWGDRGGKCIGGIKDKRRMVITCVFVTKKQIWLPICRRRTEIHYYLHSGRSALSHSDGTPNVHVDYTQHCD
jgi:hypothetical protein